MADEEGADAASEFTSSSIKAAFCAWLGLFTGVVPMITATMSLFMVPVGNEFHLTRGEISAILVLSPGTTAVLAPFCGRFLDKVGFRTALLTAVAVFGLFMASRALVQNVWQLALSFMLVSIGSSLNSSVGYAKLVSIWFSRHRGLVLGLAMSLGAGLGSAIAPQIFRPLIHNHGWRQGYFWAGAFLLAVVLPLMALLLEEPPVRATSHHQEAGSAYGMTRAEAIRTRSFWFLLAAIFLASMALVGTNAHAMPLLTERGFQPEAAVTEISCFYIGGIIGQFSCGWVSDRVDSYLVVTPYYFMAFVGLVIVQTTTSTGLLFPGAVVMGLGQGAEIAFSAYLTSRYFGLKAYGAIYAIFYSASSAGIALGLYVMGAAHDVFGSYRPMALIFGGILAVATLLVATMGPYRYASRRPRAVVKVAAAEEASA
jgi:MFS family permease